MGAVLPDSEEQRIIGGERLRLLEIGYYVRAGMTFLFSSFFLLYVVMLLGISFIPDSAWKDASQRPVVQPGVEASSPAPTTSAPATSNPPPKFLFRLMAGFIGLFVALGWGFAALSAYAGYCIRQRQRKLLVQIAAALNCLFLPYGTLLGVMTFLTLGTPAGKLEFDRRG